MATCILMRVTDEQSSPRICRHWRRHRACTYSRSRHPSSPHQRHNGSHYARTPEGRRSHPAGDREEVSAGSLLLLFFFFSLHMITVSYKKSYRPGRNQCLLSCCLHRTCCHPACSRKRGGLYISPERLGEHERPTDGWYRTSLQHEESQAVR